MADERKSPLGDTSADLFESSQRSVSEDSGFDVLEVRGGGAFGDVYKARDRRLQRIVALKFIASDHPASPTMRQRFLSEARNLASLDHRNIVGIHSVEDRDDGSICLCLEWVDGETVSEIVEREGPMSAEEAARIGIELCRALSCVHAKQLVHRDIKPSNVMRARGGRIVLLDFGIAYSRNEGELAAPAGTPYFMAPEQYRVSGTLGPRTDLYSVGVLLYWLVSNQTPWVAETLESLREQIIHEDPTPLLDHNPHIASSFADVVGQAIRRDEKKRFESAGELENALREFLAGAHSTPSVVPSTSTSDEEAVTWYGPKSKVAWFVVALLVFSLGLSLWLSSREVDRFEARVERWRDGRSRTLVSGDPVEVGDQLLLHLDLPHPVYVYFFNVDDADFCRSLFPSADFQLGNPLPAGPIELPGFDRDGRRAGWNVDTQGAGGETLLLVVSEEPVSWAEEIHRSTRLALARMSPQSKEQLYRSIGSASVLNVDEEGPETSPSLLDLLSRDGVRVLERTNELRGTGVFRIYFRNTSERPTPDSTHPAQSDSEESD